jgi:hypothetical protein
MLTPTDVCDHYWCGHDDREVPARLLVLKTNRIIEVMLLPKPIGTCRNRICLGSRLQRIDLCRVQPGKW